MPQEAEVTSSNPPSPLVWTCQKKKKKKKKSHQSGWEPVGLLVCYAMCGFHPIICSRHHCRFCGGIFCNKCSKGRCLLPSKFHTRNPFDICFVRLEFVQAYLIDQISHAAQLPTHDLTDLSTLRSWLNFPWV
jgi:hypothetical protein